MYLIETSNSKFPDEKELGKRVIKRHNATSEITHISSESILDNSKQYDGYINRNIRLSLALIDSSSPYIKIVSVRNDVGHTHKISW
jgi:hypothetical protein